MLRQIASGDLSSVDLVPQAIIAQSTEQIAKRLDLAVENRMDDLDVYEGFAFRLDDGMPVAVRHYQGHPDKTVTIYLPFRDNDGARVAALLPQLVKELGATSGDVIWQRSEDPSL